MSGFLTVNELYDVILLGDCLDRLKQIPNNSVDAIVVDPPYGLGTREPTIEEIIAYLAGVRLDTGGDFMGAKWEIPPIAVWQECLRVLKPGGHLLSFGGTRTWDIISMGLRAAGFECRDTIADEFGSNVLQWVHSQGFPKSLNVGAKLEKQKHPEAIKWKGWGTALKPSWEPIMVFRKPFDGTVVQNLLEHETGAFNIDGTRISTNGEQLSISSSDPFHNAAGDQRWNPTSSGAIEREQHEGGRWPTNLTLTHHPECRQIGTRTIRGDQRGDPGGRRPGGFANVGAENGDKAPNARVYGNEEVPVYECVDGCPILELEGQSTGKTVVDTAPSRFFPNFEGQEPPDAPFFYCAKAAKKETTLGGRIENDHPTRKPLKLMRWLVRLVCPKGGLVLDPYCGSGSTLHAAVLERMHFLGIEKHEPYHRIATERLEIVMEEAKELYGQQDSFDLIMSGELFEDE